MNVRHITNDAGVVRGYSLLKQLRPSHDDAQFHEQLLRQLDTGYCLLAIADDDYVYAIVGYRWCENLARGRYIFIEDFVVDEAVRNGGHGEQLFDALVELADEHGYGSVELDVGIQRQDALRFYLNQRMVTSAFHLALELTPPEV